MNTNTQTPQFQGDYGGGWGVGQHDAVTRVHHAMRAQRTHRDAGAYTTKIEWVITSKCSNGCGRGGGEEGTAAPCSCVPWWARGGTDCTLVMAAGTGTPFH